MVSSWWGGVFCGDILRGGWSLRGLAGGERAQCGLWIMNTGSSIWRGRGVPGWECHLVSPTAEAASLSSGLLRVWWWCTGIGGVVAITVRAFSLGCGSACCVVEPLEGFSRGHVVDWLDVSEGEVVGRQSALHGVVSR